MKLLLAVMLFAVVAAPAQAQSCRGVPLPLLTRAYVGAGREAGDWNMDRRYESTALEVRGGLGGVLLRTGLLSAAGTKGDAEFFEYDVAYKGGEVGYLVGISGGSDEPYFLCPGIGVRAVQFDLGNGSGSYVDVPATFSFGYAIDIGSLAVVPHATFGAAYYKREQAPGAPTEGPTPEIKESGGRVVNRVGMSFGYGPVVAAAELLHNMTPGKQFALRLFWVF